MGRYGKRADMRVHEYEPFNAEPPLGGLAGHKITPLDAFYVRGHGGVPEIDRSSWRLEVRGLVERPLEIGFDELCDGRLPQREVVATLQCAGNRREGLIEVRAIPGESPWAAGATGTARWRGGRTRGPAARHRGRRRRDARRVRRRPTVRGGLARQRYESSIPLSKALADEVLLAVEMNGAPLEAVHGAPVRVVVPGYIGARSVKWLGSRRGSRRSLGRLLPGRRLPAARSRRDARAGRPACRSGRCP